MKQSLGFEILHNEQKIVMTRAFDKAAGYAGSPECNRLFELRKAFPDYVICLRSIEKASSKRTYHNLTYDRMKAFILIKEGPDSEAYQQFTRLTDSAAAYATVKHWFLTTYPDQFQKQS